MAHFLLIGASSAIGQSIKKLLQDAGHTTFTTARDQKKVKPDSILDAANFEAVEEVFKIAGPINGVVNCAGSLLLKPAHTTTYSEYLNSIHSSLTTAFAVIRACGKYMTQGGSVVLISSSAALQGFANHEAIATAKAGIIGLTLSAAATYAHLNLRVNAIAPGLVETPLTAFITNNKISREFSENMHPLKRLGKTDDIARAVIFLLEPLNSWITGQILAVDGGLSSLKINKK